MCQFWQLVREWKVQSQGVHRDFHGSTRDYLAGRPSSREKYLEKFFKFLPSMCFAAYLATNWRLDPVVKNACFAFSGQFFKTCSVFPRVSVTIHCLPQNISLKHLVSLLKRLPFLHNVFFKHQEKGMSFLYLTSLFLIWTLFSWFVRYNYVLWNNMFEHEFA